MRTAKRHRRARKHQYNDVGAPPGTLISSPECGPSRIRVMAYGPDEHEEYDVRDVADIAGMLKKWPVVWVNVDGLGDVDTVVKLGELFDLHGLALEDVLSLHHRPKAEEYGGNLFVVIHMLEAGQDLQTEQLSIFIGRNFVVTFQEEPFHDCLDPVRKRIRQNLGQIRETGTDYLAYALLDAVIDAYFPEMDLLSDRIESLETEVVEQPTRQTVAKIHEMKRDLLMIRRTISPLREAINFLMRDGSKLFSDTTRVYLRDCYDHVIHLLDFVETYREITSGLLDVYLSSVSNRLNEIMKVLTIITTIFIPISFLAGVYGMNFHVEKSPLNMPELTWYLGYPLFWAVVIAATAVQLLLFWWKGWLGGNGPRPKKNDSRSDGLDGSDG